MVQSLGILYLHGDLEEYPGSWLWISSDLVIVATWGVSQVDSSLYCLLCKFALKKIFF